MFLQRGVLQPRKEAAVNFGCPPVYHAALINPIIERKRLLNPWDWSEDINATGKAWDKVYSNGSGNHKVIPKQIVKNIG